MANVTALSALSESPGFNSQQSQGSTQLLTDKYAGKTQMHIN